MESRRAARMPKCKRESCGWLRRTWIPRGCFRRKRRDCRPARNWPAVSAWSASSPPAEWVMSMRSTTSRLGDQIALKGLSGPKVVSHPQDALAVQARDPVRQASHPSECVPHSRSGVASGRGNRDPLSHHGAAPRRNAGASAPHDRPDRAATSSSVDRANGRGIGGRARSGHHPPRLQALECDVDRPGRESPSRHYRFRSGPPQRRRRRCFTHGIGAGRGDAGLHGARAIRLAAN